MNEPKRGPVPGSPTAKNGGNAVKAKYGRDFYRQIGKRGGEAAREKGPEFYAQIGRKGGEATKASQDADFYKRIGAKGGSAKVTK